MTMLSVLAWLVAVLGGVTVFAFTKAIIMLLDSLEVGYGNNQRENLRMC